MAPLRLCDPIPECFGVVGVLYMSKVPSNRYREAKQVGAISEERPTSVLVVRPEPAMLPVLPIEGDEIDGESVIVRRLPSSRFRGPLFEDVLLPKGTAERLEGFEAELRATGLIGKSQVLRQIRKGYASFRVQSLQRVYTSGNVMVETAHDILLPVEQAERTVGPSSAVSSAARTASTEGVPSRVPEGLAKPLTGERSSSVSARLRAEMCIVRRSRRGA